MRVSPIELMTCQKQCRQSHNYVYEQRSANRLPRYSNTTRLISSHSRAVKRALEVKKATGQASGTGPEPDGNKSSKSTFPTSLVPRSALRAGRFPLRTRRYNPVSPGTFPAAKEESKSFPCVCCDSESSDDAVEGTKFCDSFCYGHN